MNNLTPYKLKVSNEDLEDLQKEIENLQDCQIRLLLSLGKQELI